MSDPMSTRHEGAGPGATRREDIGPAATRREESAPGRGWAMVMAESLPADLAERLSELTPIASTGGEASIVKARDAACGGQWRLLKAYYPHIQPDLEVLSQLASIRSRNVVEVVETGTLADGRVFELMEFLPDGSLRDAGAGRRAFDAASVTRIVRQLAAGLTALHQRGITHRDLKPENVLVRGRLPDIELVLTDFGLSRRLDSSAHFTTGARTSAYAAPESWAGHVSPARDWWSLGIMVHELITGQQPFQGLDERMIQVAVTPSPFRST